MTKPKAHCGKKKSPASFWRNPPLRLEEFETAIGLRLRNEDEAEEIDTLGGLIFLRTGRVPTRGEIVPHETGAEFEVVDADPRRLKRVRVRLPGAARARPMLQIRRLMFARARNVWPGWRAALSVALVGAVMATGQAPLGSLVAGFAGFGLADPDDRARHPQARLSGLGCLRGRGISPPR